jgi:SPP1 gp7 family putative phage head morphogenesis protein
MTYTMRSTITDAKTKKAMKAQGKNVKTLRGKFKPSRDAEKQFYKSLKKVAQVSGHIVEQYTDLQSISITNEAAMMKAVEEYSKTITPWAYSQSAKLLNAVQKSNSRAYKNVNKKIGRLLESDLLESGNEMLAKDLMDEQVALIKSIPIEAAKRAQKIAYENFLKGTRAKPDNDIVKQFEKEERAKLGITEKDDSTEELRDQLARTTEVAISRAQLIAITETARANASINQSRAMSVGSRQYRWHNSGDGAVREAHEFYRGKPMEGMIFSWDSPPTLDDGTKGHPGTFPRCRCYAEPILDDE